MSAIQDRIAAIREGRRANYLWNNRLASAALDVGENKVGEWVYRTKRKFIELFIAMPGETAAELASWLAEAEAERQRRINP